MALYDKKGKYIGPKKEESVLAGLAKGALKGIKSTALNIGKGITAGSPALALSELVGTVKPGTQRQTVADVESLRQRTATPTTTSQKIGFAAEQIGEMFIPLGIESKVAKAVPGLAGRSIGSGLEYGAKTLIQSGGDVEETAKSAAISAAVPIAASVLKAVGKSIYKVAIPLSSEEAISVQAYRTKTPFLKRVGLALSDDYKGPIIAEETAFQQKLKGTQSSIGVQANKASKNIWSRVVKPSLDSSDEAIDMKNFWGSIEKEIVKQNPELSRQKDLLEALKALEKDYKGVKSVSLNDIQKFKEGWAKFLPEKVYRGKNIAGAFNEVKNISASTARNILYDRLGPELKTAYIDYGNLKNLAEMGQKAMTGGKLKGGFGGFWSAIKDIAVVPVGTISGRSIYKAAGLFEFIGKPGAKTVYDVFFNAD